MVISTTSTARRLPSASLVPDRPALQRVLTGLWQQAGGGPDANTVSPLSVHNAVLPGSETKEVDTAVDQILSNTQWTGAAGFVHAAASWLKIIDHRCDRPDVIATAIIEFLSLALAHPLSPPHHADPTITIGNDDDADPRILLGHVRDHDDDLECPDAMVLSDVLLSDLGDDAEPHDIFTRVERLHELAPAVIPSVDDLHASMSIFYTPEARARLEGRARLNIARAHRQPQPTQ